MVKSGAHRAKHYANFVKADVSYLTTKLKMRSRATDVSQIATISALKDGAGKVIIDSFNLRARKKVLAWQAWRELYFMYYRYQPVLETP